MLLASLVVYPRVDPAVLHTKLVVHQNLQISSASLFRQPKTLICFHNPLKTPHFTFAVGLEANLAITMLHLVATALVASVCGIAYFVNLLHKKRREMDGLPCPPMQSRFWGHLDIAGECTKLFPPKAHPHSYIRWMQKKYNQGEIFYIDWWPFGPRWMFISDPELTSQYITTKQNLPKSPLETDFLDMFLGTNNMLSLEGDHWKSLRSIFNPGFSANHLMTMVPYIVDASTVFYDVLRGKAQTNDLFQLEEAATHVTIDIIGKVVLDCDFDSQKAPHPIVDTFRARVFVMPVTSPILDLSFLEIPRRIRLWLNGRKLDRMIGEELDRKIAMRSSDPSAQPKSFKERKKSVVDLAIDAWQQEHRASGKEIGANQTMTGSFRKDIIDQIKTAIFAGHDTTASTISYALYLLHFHPKCRKGLATEIDSVFGENSSKDTISEAMKRDPYIINKLEYTTAVLKETLRLFPPASTLRKIPEASDPSKIVYMTHPKTGQKFPLNGWDIWPAVSTIGRNERFFPSPVEFIPERFIQSLTPFPDSELFTPAGKDAWRPFEKGPRNCIGQELAMIEQKVVMALIGKDFDFVAEYDGVKCESIKPVETVDEFEDGKKGSERLTIEGHSVYQVLMSSAKPRDGMPGRLRYIGSEKSE